MEGILQTLLTALLAGGPGAIIAILVGIIAFLMWERKKLVEAIDKKEEKIEKIIDDYYKGYLTLTEALNGLKMVLMEMKGKL
jgi:F0F1-type ATP synthase membrane subunit b/b'